MPLCNYFQEHSYFFVMCLFFWQFVFVDNSPVFLEEADMLFVAGTKKNCRLCCLLVVKNQNTEVDGVERQVLCTWFYRAENISWPLAIFRAIFYNGHPQFCFKLYIWPINFLGKPKALFSAVVLAQWLCSCKFSHNAATWFHGLLVKQWSSNL